LGRSNMGIYGCLRGGNRPEAVVTADE